MATSKNAKELSGKQKFLNGLSSFLEKNKKLLIILLAVIFVAVIVSAVITNLSEKRNNEAALSVEALQEKYVEWQSFTDEEEADKTALEQEIIADAETLISEYKGSYAAQKAYFLSGNMKSAAEKYDEAADYYVKSSEVNKKSYLAPVSIMLAAISYENSGNDEKAIGMYQNIAENYSDTYADAPRAILSLGRLYEASGDIDKAVEYYNSLIDEFPSNGWTDFAHTRLIQLNK